MYALDVKNYAIAQPKGHTPLLIFRYVSVSSLDFGDRLRPCRSLEQSQEILDNYTGFYCLN